MRADLPLGKPARRPGARFWRPSRRLATMLVIAAIVLAGGYAIYQRFTSAPEAAPEFQTVPVQTGPLVSTVTSSGTLATTRQAELSFTAAGRLAEMNVQVGDTVKASQVLAQLDTTDLEIKVAQAESAVRVSQIKVDQLSEGATAEEIEAARAAVDAALVKFQDTAAGATQTDLEAAQGAVEQAKIALASAEAKLEELRSGATQADLSSAQASVDQARSNLVSAEAKLEQLQAGPTQSEWASAQASVDSASANLKAAQSKLEQVLAGPTQSELAAAQASVDQAKASMTTAEDRWAKAKDDGEDEAGVSSEEYAEQSYLAAQASYESAVQKLNELRSGPLPAETQSAQSSVDSAQASYSSALAKLDEMKSGPLASDVNSAQRSVDAARASLASAEAKLEQLQAGTTQPDLLSAENSVATARLNLASAEAKLADLRAGPSNVDLQAARSSLASAESQLALKAAGPKATELALAEEQVIQSEISLRQAKLDLEGATLVAPFDGIVAATGVSAGEQVGGSSAAVTLVDPTALRVDLSVDETDVAKLAVGQPATVSFDALPDERLRGQVIAVAPSGTAQQGVVTYLVSIGIDSPSRSLPSGMSATVDIETERKDGVLLVPNRAVRTQGRARTVEVLVDGTPEVRMVQTGSSNDQLTEIVSGLQDGELVVIRGTSTLQPRTGFGMGNQPAVKVRQ